MPTYQYRCKECDHELEVVQSFNDEPLTECPECGAQLRKVYGAVGISFKGSGFYKTDSRSSSGSKSKSSSTSSDSSKSTSDSSSSSESTSSKPDKAPAASSSSSSTD